jgi:hypothetical protein
MGPRTPPVPMSKTGTPLKAFGRSNCASIVNGDTVVSIDTPQGRGVAPSTFPAKSPYKPGRVPQPGPSRCPSSPPKFHRMPPAIGDKVEPMNRILPPPRETPKKDAGQPLQSPLKEELAHQRQVSASPRIESSDKAHQSVWNQSPGRRRSDILATATGTLQAIPSRSPPVAVCVEVLKSPVLRHRSVVEGTPRGGGSLVEWMHSMHGRGSQPALDLENDDAKMSL